MLPRSLAVGRIHFIVIGGLKYPLSCWLSAWYHHQILGATLRSLPCATSHLSNREIHLKGQPATFKRSASATGVSEGKNASHIAKSRFSEMKPRDNMMTRILKKILVWKSWKFQIPQVSWVKIIYKWHRHFCHMQQPFIISFSERSDSCYICGHRVFYISLSLVG